MGGGAQDACAALGDVQDALKADLGTLERVRAALLLRPSLTRVPQVALEARKYCEQLAKCAAQQERFVRTLKAAAAHGTSAGGRRVQEVCYRICNAHVSVVVATCGPNTPLFLLRAYIIIPSPTPRATL